MSTPKTDTTLQLPEAEIRAELETLRAEMCSMSHCGQPTPDTENAIWIFRMFNGINMEDWEQVSENVDSAQWLALPLNGNAYPFLKSIQATIQRLAFQTEHDALTGLANRRAFDSFLFTEIERTNRTKTPVSLALIDLDDFKKVNDTYGHDVGDDVLVGLASLLSDLTRKYDLAARYGGEEFAVILPGTAQVKAKAAFNRLLNKLRKTTFKTGDGTEFAVTASVGLATFRGRREITLKQFVKEADEALYKAKAGGKDRIVLAPMADLDPDTRRTLVQSDEKQFLFGK